LTLTVAPECSVGITSVSRGDANSQTITFTYKLRTSASGGHGQILLRSAGSGAYQTALDGPGTPLSGATASLDSGVVIARFGPDARTGPAGSGGRVQVSASSTTASSPLLVISCH
jgi:hypothetical protein